MKSGLFVSLKICEHGIRYWFHIQLGIAKAFSRGQETEVYDTTVVRNTAHCLTGLGVLVITQTLAS